LHDWHAIGESLEKAKSFVSAIEAQFATAPTIL
jgi:hypothetical protein